MALIHQAFPACWNVSLPGSADAPDSPASATQLLFQDGLSSEATETLAAAYKTSTQKAYARMCASMLQEAFNPPATNPLLRTPLLMTYENGNLIYLYSKTPAAHWKQPKQVIPASLLSSLVSDPQNYNELATTLLDVLYSNAESVSKEAESKTTDLVGAEDAVQNFSPQRTRAPLETRYAQVIGNADGLTAALKIAVGPLEVEDKSNHDVSCSEKGYSDKDVFSDDEVSFWNKSSEFEQSNESQTVSSAGNKNDEIIGEKASLKRGPELDVEHRSEPHPPTSPLSPGVNDEIFRIESEDDDEPIALLKERWSHRMTPKSKKRPVFLQQSDPGIASTSVAERGTADISNDQSRARDTSPRLLSAPGVKRPAMLKGKRHRDSTESDDSGDEDFVPDTKRVRFFKSDDIKSKQPRDISKSKGRSIEKTQPRRTNDTIDEPPPKAKQHKNVGRERNGPFSDAEHAAILAEVRARRNLEAADPEEPKLRDQPFWEYILKHLHKRGQCLTRASFGSLKNYWNRVGRAKSQFEERLNTPKNGSLTASVQKPLGGGRKRSGSGF